MKLWRKETPAKRELLVHFPHFVHRTPVRFTPAPEMKFEFHHFSGTSGFIPHPRYTAPIQK
jgi:hypothetical protein